MFTSIRSSSGTRNRGFASMNLDKQREIARKGGRAAHAKGTAHEFTTDEARAAGRKGGESVSSNREHMSRIGRIGGKASAARRSDPDDAEVTYPGEAFPRSVGSGSPAGVQDRAMPNGPAVSRDGPGESQPGNGGMTSADRGHGYLDRR